MSDLLQEVARMYPPPEVSPQRSSLITSSVGSTDSGTDEKKYSNGDKWRIALIVALITSLITLIIYLLSSSRQENQQLNKACLYLGLQTIIVFLASRLLLEIFIK